MNSQVISKMTCSATQSITTIDPTAVINNLGVDGPGDLLMIAPDVEFGPGFNVELGGILGVISADPSPPASGPAP